MAEKKQTFLKVTIAQNPKIIERDEHFDKLIIEIAQTL